MAARGIDVKDIAHVVNYDLPNASEDFVHRIGRTGRAGKKGVATTFVMPQEKSDARKIERDLKIKFEWREADKNLQKEERNKPVDMSAPAAGNGDVMQMETRSWRGNDPVTPMTPNPFSTRAQGAPRPGGRGPGGGNGGRSNGPGSNSGAPRSGNRSAASRVNRGTRGR